MTVFAKSFGPPPPPAGGPMGGPPPAGGGMPPAPQQFPAPTGGPQAPLPAGNAGRRKKFGAALEGMIQPPARPPQPPQRQMPPMPPQLPPRMGGNSPAMMPRNPMVAPGTPMMRTPTARPMAMGGEVDIFGYDDGGAVMGTYGWGGGEGTYGVTQARDSFGDIVPGMFVAKYADGSYSAPVTAANVEGLRQGILNGTVTSGDYTADEAANMAGGSTYLKTDNVNVVDEDVSGGFGSALGMSNEMLGNDTVFVNFADGTKVTTQKGMIDAMNEYGLFDGIQSRDDFNKMVGDISAASVRDPESDLGKAHSLFNEKQIAYNEALRNSDPNIQKNIDTFRGYYAPEPASSTVPDPSSSTVDPYSGSYTPDPVDSSQVGEINYDDFTGDIGATYTGYPETSQTPDNAALFGPNVNIPQRVSQYYTDAVTGGLTTTNGPVMTATSPIGAINLPARPVSIDIFDWLRSPTYGSIDPIKNAKEEEEASLGLGDNILKLQEGGAVNSFDDGTYTIRDLNSGETEKYESGQSYGEEDLPADVAYSKQVQENREKLGLPANETSAWSMWQQGTHWSQQRSSTPDWISAPDEGSINKQVITPIANPDTGEIFNAPNSGYTLAAESAQATEPAQINYDNFTGDIGETYGGYPEGSRTPDTAALFGPNVNIPKVESKYVQDPVTRTITTTNGPRMTAVSPIGAINLPASPIDLDIFDFLRDPTYGSLNPIGLKNGGSVPRNTMIADQPHMLAYINQDEEALLRSFGGSGVSGPGGIPSYPPDSVIDADYSIISGGGGHPTDDDDKPSKNVTYYEPPGFDFDGDGVSGEGSDVLDNNDSNPFVDIDDDPVTPVTPTYDPSDEDYGGESSETDFDQPVVVDKTVVTPKPKPRPTYNDLHGNTFYSQAEADASNRAYAAQAALYGSGKVGFDRFKSDAASVFPGRDREETDRMAARAYPDFVENYSRDINIFDAAPYTYAGIGGVGAGPADGGVGITPAPVVDPSVSPTEDVPGLLNKDVKDVFLSGQNVLEGKPVISLDAPADPNYVPSAFPSGRSEADIFQPPQEADEGATKEALMNAVKQRVSEVEGTTTDEYGEGGYSRLLGNTEKKFLSKPLTEMTVKEVLDFQKKRGEDSYAEYSKGVNKKIGSLREDGSPNISTPAGKYQIVGDTLEKLIKDGVVDPDAKFDAATQEKLGSYLIEKRGLFDTDTSREDFVTSLGQEFAGIKDKGYDGTISSQLKQGLGASDRGLGPDDDPRRANLAVNAAEAKYLQQLLKGVDDPNMLEKILGKIGSNLTLGMVDFNQLSRDQAQKVLDAYRDTGSFVYDTEGNAIDLKTVEDLEKLEALSAGEGQQPAVIGVRDEDGNVVSYGSDIQNTMEGPVEVDIFDQISESDGDTSTDKNYTVGPDGSITCNDEGYVYSEAAGMCVPVEEEETDGTPTIAPRDVTTRSLDDIIAGIATPGPKIAPISANIRPMQGGGMAGLNRAADNFLKALAG